MPPKESRYPNDWLALAEKDLLRVTRSLRDKDPELAAFCLQQAVEKFLKAYLLSKGWKLRRIHDLEALLDDAMAHDPSLDQFRNSCQKITNYYVVERYPLAVEVEFTADEVRTSLESAGQLIEKLRRGIP
ncbi:MAG: HEPN domain-containing protein [Deltaproteobacteria bacterium]|nr:HEPN domain-containing protein [Deltaproteobacteria bacterium]MDZ4340857.1 HEPN domain-containing protein [Candidatus Binatia bacterium]